MPFVGSVVALVINLNDATLEFFVHDGLVSLIIEVSAETFIDVTFASLGKYVVKFTVSVCTSSQE